MRRGPPDDGGAIIIHVSIALPGALTSAESMAGWG